jgi:hypothetical protein
MLEVTAIATLRILKMGAIQSFRVPNLTREPSKTEQRSEGKIFLPATEMRSKYKQIAVRNNLKMTRCKF